MPYRTELKRPDLKGQFPCSVCGKVFCHSSSLSRHRMQAHFKSYTCTQCNQEISSNETLRSHMYRFHQISRMFMCRCCNWAFPDKTSLHIHMQSMIRNGNPGDVSVLARSSVEGDPIDFSHSHSSSPFGDRDSMSPGEADILGAPKMDVAGVSGIRAPQNPLMNPLMFNGQLQAAAMNNGIFRNEMLRHLEGLAKGATPNQQETAKKDAGVSANDIAGVLQNNAWLASWVANNAFQMQLSSLYQQQQSQPSKEQLESTTAAAVKGIKKEEKASSASGSTGIFNKHRSLSPPTAKRQMVDVKEEPAAHGLSMTAEEFMNGMDMSDLMVEVSCEPHSTPKSSGRSSTAEGKLSFVIDSLTQARLNVGKESPNDGSGSRPNKRKARKPQQLSSEVASIQYQTDGSEDKELHASAEVGFATPGHEQQSQGQPSPAVSDSQTSGSSAHEHAISTVTKCSCLETIRQCESEIEHAGLEEPVDGASTSVNTEELTSRLQRTKLDHVGHVADLALQLLPVDAAPELNKLLRELVLMTSH
ncbi:CBN-HAM-2 protein [Aphelenchoides avenae]|nr:CBN-HAM-2 protein [Aphelenchus avenae]